MRNYPEIGLQVPEVLIPENKENFQFWSIVACDQFTSQPEYWQKVEAFINNYPSTYHMVLPEAFLGSPKELTHAAQINRNMVDYLRNGIFSRHNGFVYVEREVSSGVRKGLMVALDLECYDFNEKSTSLIRATEGTILDRLPPRIKIREGAPLEIPHIMVLIDDPEFSVLEPLSAKRDDLKKLYDFGLMMDSGHITGFLVDQPEIEEKIIVNLMNLYLKNTSKSMGNGVLFAVGDGNHSLATAKAIWEKIKSSVPNDHPARYALVELVNIHDPALHFESIHRLLTAPEFDCHEELLKYFSNNISFSEKNDFGSLCAAVNSSLTQSFGITCANSNTMVSLPKPPHTLAVGSLQAFLDDILINNPRFNLDYIHGSEVLQKLSDSPDNFGFYLPAMVKSALFPSIAKDGPLPKKTFSMGQAQDKRFYLECRRILPDA